MMKKHPFQSGIIVSSRWFLVVLIAAMACSGTTLAADRMVLGEAFLLCGV